MQASCRAHTASLRHRHDREKSLLTNRAGTGFSPDKPAATLHAAPAACALAATQRAERPETGARTKRDNEKSNESYNTHCTAQHTYR